MRGDGRLHADEGKVISARSREGGTGAGSVIKLLVSAKAVNKGNLSSRPISHVVQTRPDSAGQHRLATLKNKKQPYVDLTRTSSRGRGGLPH